MTTIPAILCSYADEQTAALGLLENIQRTDLNPFEQAQGLRDILVLWTAPSRGRQAAGPFCTESIADYIAGRILYQD